MQKIEGQLLYSPTDLIRYLSSPFASWMERHFLENPKAVTPDKDSEERRLIAETGDKHEASILAGIRSPTPGMFEISKKNLSDAREKTAAALKLGAPVVYQAFLEMDGFAGYSDFLIRSSAGDYQVWDSKLARRAKPYYAIQLCCYSEMLARLQNGKLPEKFGVILGTKERVEFRVEDYFHYYLSLKDAFLKMHSDFSGRMEDRPEPVPNADHGRWTTNAEAFFEEADHVVRVAGITMGQIKKLKREGIATMACLAQAAERTVPGLAKETLFQLADQARLQCLTRAKQTEEKKALPAFDLLETAGPGGQKIGLATLPPPNRADVFFDMEGYPLVPGGLEYLFGASWFSESNGSLNFSDWWAHDREAEKATFEGFVDWVFKRWKGNPEMHLYHYARYEVDAMRRLSTRHDTRQEEIDELLRNEVFVDLYQIVRHALRIGTPDYSIKTIECLYRPKRTTEVATAVGSMVEYAKWIESGEPKDWNKSPILKPIRDYNEDDCKSTAELLAWLTKIASERGITLTTQSSETPGEEEEREIPEAAQKRAQICRDLRQKANPMSVVLADLIDFHRREAKPIWWRMFDRAKATEEELRDDPACIAGVSASGACVSEKRSLVQGYQFDPPQECKLAADDDSRVMFRHDLKTKLNLTALDLEAGNLALKLSKAKVESSFNGRFPLTGSLLADEYVSPAGIPDALAAVAEGHLNNALHPSVAALLRRIPAVSEIQRDNEDSTDAAVRVAISMNCGCFVCQGPPGTGKTHTASRVIAALLRAGKRVGVASNGHKAIENLLKASGEAMADEGGLRGIKVCGDGAGELFSNNPGLKHIEKNPKGFENYQGGIVGGTAWLFTRPEWERALDYLFIDEAGEVSLANAVAMARSASNLILLGDQMQLEQPVQGSHPGDAGLSVLQYALKDEAKSRPDSPEFPAVVPADYGLFLRETRRMHPSICDFISESIYEGRLHSHPDCSRQKIALPRNGGNLIRKESGIVFLGVPHDGNIQQSDEEVSKVVEILNELQGREYTNKKGEAAPLNLKDFLFITPYNAQVRALQTALPKEARVGSVDKFQGQEAAVCVLSLCSSFGEYGSRGLGFILDQNRINVAISRAKCLAVVVADPRIAATDAGSLDEMRLLNIFCKLVKS